MIYQKLDSQTPEKMQCKMFLNIQYNDNDDNNNRPNNKLCKCLKKGMAAVLL